MDITRYTWEVLGPLFGGLRIENIERIDALAGIGMTGVRFDGFREHPNSLDIYGTLIRYGDVTYRSGRVQRMAIYSVVSLDSDKLIISDDIETRYVEEKIVDGVNRLRRVCVLADSGLLFFCGKRRRGRPIAGIKWLQWPEELSTGSVVYEGKKEN